LAVSTPAPDTIATLVASAVKPYAKLRAALIMGGPSWMEMTDRRDGGAIVYGSILTSLFKRVFNRAPIYFDETGENGSMAGSESRRSLRVEPRGLVPRTGKLLLGPQAAPVDCQVVNLSAGGACLKLSVLQRLPKRFEFLHGATRKLSQLVWQRGYLIGICYEASVSKSLLGCKPSGDGAKQSSLSRRRS
jgi:hypothetical protein